MRPNSTTYSTFPIRWTPGCPGVHRVRRPTVLSNSGLELRDWSAAAQFSRHGSHLSSLAADRSSSTNGFVILTQAPVPSQSGKSALQDPARGRAWTPESRFGTVHDCKGPVHGLPHPAILEPASPASVQKLCNAGSDASAGPRPTGRRLGPVGQRVALPPPATGPGYPPPNAFAALYLLARVVASGPSLSVVCTDRLSRIAALGRRASWILGQTASRRSTRK